MAFNIHELVFNRDGSPLEKKARKYQDELMGLFAKSPEGQGLLDEGYDLGWANMLLDFGINYLSLTPPQMIPRSIRDILIELIPRKVSAMADEAPNIVHELRGFWKFLQREFRLVNAAACLKVLDDKMVRELKKEMNNPENFGIAKSFMMMGMQRGFDLDSEEGINTWMETYNAEIAAGAGPRIPLPGEQSKDAQQFRSTLKIGRSGRVRRTDRKRKKYP